MLMDKAISIAIEGLVDEVVARKIILHAGGVPGTTYGRMGKNYLIRRIPGFNNAAKYYPWMILIDLDNDADCAPPFARDLIPDPSYFLCFRVAVREIESWLLADSGTLAPYLGIPHSKIPCDPESINDPKTEMVNLARQSRLKEVRNDMVPRKGSGREVGPAYKSRLIEYVQSRWRPEIAAQKADSLRRAMTGIKRLIGMTS